HSEMLALTRQLTETDSLYCNPSDDGQSTKTGMTAKSGGKAPSIKSVKSTATSSTSSTKSTKSKSTTRSKSSTASQPKTENWKASTDLMGMSSKSITPGFMPMFSTHLYSPGFAVPNQSKAKASGGPKSFQSKQFKVVEKKTASSAASTKSGKSSKSHKSDKTLASDNKSVKSSSSSTKSTIFSSFTGGFSSQSDMKLDETVKNSSSSNSIHGSMSKKSEKEKDEGTSKESTKDSKGTLESTSAKTSIPPVPPVPSVPSTPTTTVDKTMPSKTISPPSSSRGNEPTSLMSVTSPTGSDFKVFVEDHSSATTRDILLNHGLERPPTIPAAAAVATQERYFTPELVQKRTHHHFMLGNSMGHVLDIPHLTDFAKSLHALLNEYDNFLVSESKSKMTFFGRKTTESKSSDDSGEYTHFELRSVPFEMDYTIVFATLCEMIVEAYKKFDPHPAAPLGTSNISDLELFHKIDTRLKKISANATRELENLTRDSLQEELNSIDPLGSMMAEWDQQVLSIGH
ncbi:hypothetical protein BGW38_004780, partial [Lunasporangiospora selenospora]